MREPLVPTKRVALASVVTFIGHVLVVVVCAWFLAQATFFLLAEPRLPLTKTAPIETATRANSTPAWHGETVLTRNLFGAKSAPDAILQNSVSTNTKSRTSESNELGALPLSTRGWKLLGTIVATDPAASRAVIATGGSQKSYGEGDSIEDSEVAHIQRKTVILQKGAQRERLVIDTGEERDPPATLSTRTEKPRLTTDPAALLRDISLKPRSLEGVQGMEITTLRAGSPLHELGLRTGDLVVSVNDLPVRTFDDLPKLITVINAQTVRVSLIRNGSTLTLE